MFCFSLEYEFVGENIRCVGERTSIGHLPSLSACAFACRLNTTRFIYGRKDSSRCTPTTCICRCEDDSLAGVCVKGETVAEYYDSYRIKKGKHLK